MKATIVLPTYNGADYIQELLDSLKNQRRKADEVIIIDDCSKDNTVELIKEFIKENNLKNWSLSINKKNLGWRKNFIKALEGVSGDVIFPCDQDDIWEKDKIATLMEGFENVDDMMLFASGYRAFGNNNIILSQHKVNTFLTKDEYRKQVFNEKYYQILRPGCTMAFNRKLINILMKVWTDDSPYDAVLWTIASLLEGLYITDRQLINYRQHDKNASKVMAHDYKSKLNEVIRTRIINDWYLENQYYNEEKKKLIERCNEWCNLREGLIEKGKLFNWFKLLKYRSYYLTNKKYLGDIYYFLIKISVKK